MAKFAITNYYKDMPLFYSKSFAFVVLLFFLTVILFCIHHVLVWQNFLNIIPERMFDIFFTTFLLVAVFLAGRSNLLHAFEFKITRNFNIKIAFSIVDPIRRAFSCGIIQPQLYN